MQPVDPLNLWKTPPFEAYVDRSEGFFHGRGVSDDKGGLLQPVHVRTHCLLGSVMLVWHSQSHICVLTAPVSVCVFMQAIDAFLKGTKALPVNIKVPKAYTAGAPHASCIVLSLA